MYKYYFELGQAQALALAELAAVLPSTVRLLPAPADIALVESDAELDLATLQNELGGTVKTGRVFEEVAERKLSEDLQRIITDHLEKHSLRNYGLSLYGTNLSKNDRQHIGLLIKKAAKARGLSVRYVDSQTLQLPSVLIRDQLLGRGREFVLIKSPQAMYLGSTETVQDWRAWSHRDYDRPARHPVRGMLPPKLARMMINIGQLDKEQPLLDPFCGVGTVLGEAAALGFSQLIGSDKDQAAIDATKQNLDWLKQEFSLPIASLELNATSLEDLVRTKAGLYSNIVCEADLGPPDLIRQPNQMRRATFDRLRDRYERWLEELYKLLAPHGTLVLAYPRLLSPEMALPIETSAKKIGFTALNLIPETWNHPSIQDHSRLTLTYQRQDQVIGRDIVRLQK